MTYSYRHRFRDLLCGKVPFCSSFFFFFFFCVFLKASRCGSSKVTLQQTSQALLTRKEEGGPDITSPPYLGVWMLLG